MDEFDEGHVPFSIDVLKPRPHQTFNDYEAVPIELSTSADADAGAVTVLVQVYLSGGVLSFERQSNPGQPMSILLSADTSTAAQIANQTLVVTMTLVATAESVTMSVPFHQFPTHLSYLTQCDWKSRDKKLPPKDWHPDYGHIECAFRSTKAVPLFVSCEPCSLDFVWRRL
jgi:hypothetical protein